MCKLKLIHHKLHANKPKQEPHSIISIIIIT